MCGTLSTQSQLENRVGSTLISSGPVLILQSAPGCPLVRRFVLGCEKLTVDMDHNPLLKVVGDRQFCELEIPTYQQEKAMYFTLDMVHVPGMFHNGPDEMSRGPKDRMK